MRKPGSRSRAGIFIQPGYKLVNLFWNHNEGRIRSLFRLAIQSLLFLILAFGVIFFLGDILLPLLPEDSDLLTVELRNNFLFAEMLSPFIPLLAALSSIWIAGKILDRRRFKDFGFHFSWQWFVDLGFGFLLGAILMLMIFLVEWSLGWVTITGFGQSHYSGVSFGVGSLVNIFSYICIGIYEELLFRGYHLRNLAEGMNHKVVGSKTALILAFFMSSIIFGLLHAANPNANWLSTLNIILAGMFLASGYIFTGELSIPIGLHISWNYFQGAVFGFPVSGTQPAASLIGIDQLGSDLITGGNFGPEAGILGLLAMVLGTIFIFLWVKNRNRGMILKVDLARYSRQDIAGQDQVPNEISNK